MIGQLMNEREVADYLQTSVRALQAWRVRKQGPPFARINNRLVRYRKADLDEWVESQIVRAAE